MNRHSFGKGSHCRRGLLNFIGPKMMVFGPFLNQDQISGRLLKTLVFWSSSGRRNEKDHLIIILLVSFHHFVLEQFMWQ